MFRTTVIDQVFIATEVANPEENNAEHLISPPAYLLSTTHPKYVRFPWVTLYNYCHKERDIPPISTTTVLVSNHVSGSRPTAAIMSPPLAAVSTVRALTSSIAVYSSCLTQTLLQLLKHITVLALSSTGTGTSTSTTLLQD